MNELQVIVNQNLGTIDFNFEEIKADVSQMVSAYEGATFHEETAVSAKGEVATLRKIQKAIESKRIEVKKDCLKPYDEFEKKTKELVALIEVPIVAIETQVKAFEEAEKARKREDIRAAYNELIGDMKEFIPLEKIYNPKWENKSVTITAVRSDLDVVISSTSVAVSTISGMDSEAVAKALAQFKADLNLSNAIAYINNYERQKAEILAREEARRKADEERSRKELAEKEERRIREEERARIEHELHMQKEKEVILEEIKPDPVYEEPFIVGEEPFNVGERVYEVNITELEVETLEMFLDSIGAVYRRIS